MQGACCATEACTDSECVQLTDREMAVCRVICAAGASVGFSRIKRAVGLHQEILSRILKRLVTHGVVDKDGEGYSCRTGQ